MLNGLKRFVSEKLYTYIQDLPLLYVEYLDLEALGMGGGGEKQLVEFEMI